MDLTAHGARTPIPDALRASVLERVRQLDRGARAILMCASVIGRRFDIGILTATVARSRNDIRAALECACVLQLIQEDRGGSERFLFRHALTRDVLYAELLAIRTRPLHRRIARALEATPDASLENVAYHWWAAGDRRRGFRANERAGDRAAEIHANGVALVHYNRALGFAELDSECYTRLSEKIRVAKVRAGRGRFRVTR
jgi:predicted ATPase